MRIKPEVECRKGLVRTFVRCPLIEIWIGVFISIIAFYLIFRLSLSGSCFAIRYPFPEIRDEVPEIFSKRLIFETRITRIVTNLLTLDSIGFGQFVRFLIGSRSWMRQSARARRSTQILEPKILTH
jgi:hypothetical protein